MELFEINVFKLFLSGPVKTKFIYFLYELKNHLFTLQLNHMIIPQPPPPLPKTAISEKNVTLRCCILYDFCIYLKLPSHCLR